jgi:hypothetical protein
MAMKSEKRTKHLTVNPMTSASKQPFLNKRREPRHPFSGVILFVYKKNLNEGKLINWSRSGLCMQTNRFFRKGEVITISLPPSIYKNNNRRARIVWKKADGCGVQFCD